MAFTTPTQTGEVEVNTAGYAGSSTIPITLGSLTNGLLVTSFVVRTESGGMTGISATWNGTPLTANLNYNPATNRWVAILSIPVGSGDAVERNLVLTCTDWSGSTTMQGHIVWGVWEHAQQAPAPGDDADGNTATSATGTVTSTPTVDGELIYAAIVHEYASVGTAANTHLHDFDGGAWVCGAQYFIQTTAAAKAMTWAFGGSDEFWAGAVSFKAAAESSPSASISSSPSSSPSASVSASPSASVSSSPSASPSASVSSSPSASVSASPSASPSASVSSSPSASISASPSASPSTSVSASPSASVSGSPSASASVGYEELGWTLVAHRTAAFTLERQ